MSIRKLRILLLSGLMISTNLLAQEISYRDFRKFKTVLDKSDKLLEQEKYSSCIKKLIVFKENEIPYGCRKSYYSNLGECYLQLKKFDLSKVNYDKSFYAGLNAKYFEYLKSVVSNEDRAKMDFLDQLKVSYDSINNLLFSPTYLERKEVIIGITNADQEVRNNYLNSPSKDSSQLSILNIRVAQTDSLNQKLYDSICSIYGWIGRDMVLPELRNVHIVLFHASEEYRNRYIRIGYEQASKNLIDWKEVEILQSYSFLRNTMINRNSGTTIFKFDDAENVNLKFLEFVCFALCYELTDGGQYNGKEKKVRIDFYLDQNHSNKAKQLKKKMLSVFNEFGLDKSKFSFGEVRTDKSGEIKITFV